MSREIRVGDRIRDNDPRMGDRVLEVWSTLGDTRILARDRIGARYRILRRRIYTDGKPRKSGFSLIEVQP
jgi:hypothetical protein